MGSLKDFGNKHGKPIVPITDNELPPVSLIDEEHKLEPENCVHDKAFAISMSEITSDTHIATTEISKLNSMSWISISKIIREKDVALVDCLSVIYTALYHTAQTLALVVKKNIDGKINLYLGVRDKHKYKDFVSKYILQKSIAGTIPGVSYCDEQFQFSSQYDGNYVSATIGVASLKGEKKEKFIHGIERMSVYYCDPMRSGQKGGIEEVHTLLRMIIPKGTVFTHLTQWDIRKCVDNINSYPREQLQGQTPYQLSLKKFGPEILRALQLKYVAPDDVTLTPKLLK